MCTRDSALNEKLEFSGKFSRIRGLVSSEATCRALEPVGFDSEVEKSCFTVLRSCGPTTTRVVGLLPGVRKVAVWRIEEKPYVPR